MSATHSPPSPPDLVPTISSGALPQTSASEWAEDISDLLAAHVTRTPVGIVTPQLPGYFDGQKSEHTLPSNAAYATQQKTAVVDTLPDHEVPVPASLPSSKSPFQSRSSLSSSTSIHGPETIQSVAVTAGHDTLAAEVPPRSAEAAPAVPHPADSPHSLASSPADLPSEAILTSPSSSTASHEFATFSTAVHTGHSPADLRIPISPDTHVPEAVPERIRHDSVPLSTMAHTGHSSTDLLSAASPAAAVATEPDLLSELSLEFTPHERPPTPHADAAPPAPASADLALEPPLVQSPPGLDVDTSIPNTAQAGVPESPRPEPHRARDSTPLSMAVHTGHRDSSSAISPIVFSAPAFSRFTSDALVQSPPALSPHSSLSMHTSVRDFADTGGVPERALESSRHRDSTPLSMAVHTGHTGHRDSSSAISPVIFSDPASWHPAAARFASDGQLVQSPPPLSRKPTTDTGGVSEPAARHQNSTSLSMDVHTGHQDSSSAVPAPAPAPPPDAHTQLVHADAESTHRCPFRCAAAECAHRVNAKLQ
ncbi:hypothetical protein DFH08DRAFT_441195 [Mycena albidolilacea]|uniref:Uncharacterized protein n=1 Tax=Mycena albidolilacea TaxID=1033008 RepID=A0AAD7AGU4_9AGAR|nr:hypothetical protein DFH08DRAFT_441195 [Mycena albidolilacea]